MRLNLVYPLWKINPGALSSYVPIMLICAAFAICWRFRRGWGRHVLFGLGVFGIALFPALGFIDSQFQTKWQVSDHLQYLPLIAPVALAVACLAALLPRTIFNGTALLLILGLSFLTFQRARVFSSEETLFHDTLAKNPGAWGVQNDLGVLSVAKKNLPEARDYFLASLNSNPSNYEAQSNLGQVLAMQGNLAEAEPYFIAALKTKPDDFQAHKRYASLLMRERRLPEAICQQRMAIDFSPKPDIRLRLDYASLLHQAGDWRAAMAQYRQVLSLHPDSVEALNNLAWMLATAPDDSLRDGAEAVLLAEKASRLPPVKEMCVPGTLAAAYAEAGRFPEAVATAEAAVQSETNAGQTRFAAMNRQLLTLYRAGLPFHESPPSP